MEGKEKQDNISTIAGGLFAIQEMKSLIMENFTYEALDARWTMDNLAHFVKRRLLEHYQVDEKTKEIVEMVTFH